MPPPETRRWEETGTVQNFATAGPNRVLLEFVRVELARCPEFRILDVGCGAARNAAPMAALGGTVIGVDVSWPMLAGARRRVERDNLAGRVKLVRAPMDDLPMEDAIADLVVAHGIWNLARCAAEFRRGVAEAARLARPGAGLFLFTFSRNTLPSEATPVPGEPYVFTQFAGEPQCFLTEEQVTDELLAAGWERDPPGPLTEYNRPAAGTSHGAPVIYEGTFRRRHL